MTVPFKFAGLPPPNFLLALLTLIILSILGKFASGAIIGKRLHNSLETGLHIGVYTTPRGEFSIVLLAVVVGTATGISDLLFSLVVAYVIILSIVGSSFARHCDRICRTLHLP